MINQRMSLLAPFTRYFWPEFAPSPGWAAPQPLTDLYIVGDIHGCALALERLMEQIAADIRSRQEARAESADGPQAPHLVFAGDYIDRGGASAVVLAMLRRIQALWPAQSVFLRGNHEDMLLAFLDDPYGAGPQWLRHGGVQTLASFGIARALPVDASRAAFMALRDALRAAFPAGLEAWLRALPLSWASGTVWVSHAGANPYRSLRTQSARSLLWGDPRFLDVPRSDGIWVAHGHHVTDIPGLMDGRIAVDTGAVFGGKLTAAAVRREGAVEFLQA